MNKTEMRQILAAYLMQYRSRSYDELAGFVRAKHVDAVQMKSPTGADYQIEVSFFWDGRRDADVRVWGSIDESPHRPLFWWLPIYISAVTDGFIVSPEGKVFG